MRCAVVCSRLPSKLGIVRPSVGDGDLVIRQWAVCPALLLLRILLLRILLRQIICLRLLRPRQFLFRTSIEFPTAAAGQNRGSSDCYDDWRFHDDLLLSLVPATTRRGVPGSPTVCLSER